MVSENWPNVGGRRDVAKVRFAQLCKAPKDFPGFAAITNALQLIRPRRRQHPGQFCLSPRLTLDVAVIITVVSENTWSPGKRNITCGAAAIDHVKRAGHVIRMWPDWFTHLFLHNGIALPLAQSVNEPQFQ